MNKKKYSSYCNLKVKLLNVFQFILFHVKMQIISPQGNNEFNIQFFILFTFKCEFKLEHKLVEKLYTNVKDAG